MKFDLPLLDYKTRFSLWQVKMWAILAQTQDLYEALEKFGGKLSKDWNDEATAALWLKLESICMSKDLTSKMHMKMKLLTLKMKEGGSVLSHISVFKEIVADLVRWRLSMRMKI
jgi:hypothetical protein